MSQLRAPYACMSMSVRPAGSTLLSPFLRMSIGRARWVRLHILSKNNNEIIRERNKYKKSHESVAIISLRIIILVLAFIWEPSPANNYYTVLAFIWSRTVSLDTLLVWILSLQTGHSLPVHYYFRFGCLRLSTTITYPNGDDIILCAISVMVNHLSRVHGLCISLHVI